MSCLVHKVPCKEIAILLNLSPNTISTHIKNIALRFGEISQSAIPSVAKYNYSSDVLDKTWHKLKILHYARAFLIKHKKDLCVEKITIKTLFEEKYSFLQNISCDNSVQLNLIELNVSPIIKTLFKLLHNIFGISLDRMTITSLNRNDKNYALIVRSYDSPEFLLSLFEKIFGKEHSWYLEANPKSVSGIKWRKRLIPTSAFLCFLLFTTYTFYRPSKSIDHISPLIENELTFEKIKIVDQIHDVCKKQCTNLKIVILKGEKSETTLCARQFATAKKYDLKTEINAKGETQLDNSLYSISKLLATENTAFNEKLENIRSIPCDNIRKIEMINFIFAILEDYKNWCLIVDDVGNCKYINIISSIAKNFNSNGVLIFTFDEKTVVNNSEFIVDIKKTINNHSKTQDIRSIERTLDDISLAIFRNENIKAKQDINVLSQRELNKIQKINLLILEGVLQMKLGHCSMSNELLECALKLVSNEKRVNNKIMILKANILKYKALNTFLNCLNTAGVYNCIDELNIPLNILSEINHVENVNAELGDLLLTRCGMLVSTMKYENALIDVKNAEVYIKNSKVKNRYYFFNKARIELEKGHIFLRTGRIKEAEICYAKAKSLFKEIRAYDYMFRLLEQESEILIRLGKIEEAEENCKIVISDNNLFDNPYNSIFVCTAYYNMAVIQYKRKNFEQSKYYFFRFFVNAEQYISKIFPGKIEWFLKNKAKFHDVSNFVCCFKNSLDVFKQICKPDSEFITEFVYMNYINAKDNEKNKTF